MANIAENGNYNRAQVDELLKIAITSKVSSGTVFFM
jgi:hypothetical protein